MKKIILWLVKIAIAVSVMSWIIIKHKDSFVENLKNFELKYLFLAILLLLFQMAVCGVRWYSLLKVQKIDISLKEVLLLNFKSFFLSLVIPGGMIGGDVAKVAMVSSRMPKGARLEPNFSILVDRIIGMIGLFLIAIVVVICSFNFLLRVDLSGLKIPSSLNLAGIIIFLLCCFGGIGVSMVIFFHKFFERFKLIKKILNKLDKLSHGMVNRCQNALDIYSANWKMLLLWTILTMIFVHLMVFFIAWVLAIGLKIEIVSFIGLLSAIILGSIAGLLPLTPSGLGMRDYVTLVVLEAASFNNAASIPVMLSIVIIASNLIGGIAFFFPENNSNKQENNLNNLTESEAK